MSFFFFYFVFKISCNIERCHLVFDFLDEEQSPHSKKKIMRYSFIYNTAEEELQKMYARTNSNGMYKLFVLTGPFPFLGGRTNTTGERGMGHSYPDSS